MDPPALWRSRATGNTSEMRKKLRQERQEMDHEKQSEKPRNDACNSPGISPNGRVISYNVPEGERPGGIKVRFKIRIATGKRATEIDARQAAVILEVLEWQRQRNQPR
jgi:hypothetical protein